MKTPLLIITACLLTIAGWAQTQDVVKLPGAVVHTGADPRVEMPGRIACTNEILEFVAVEREGRDYESLVSVECKPSIMQAALLAIGCETGAVQQTTSNAKTGTRLTVEISWQADKETKRAPVESLLIDRQTKKPPTPLLWTFNGSYFAKNPVTEKIVFLADEERAHIALWFQSGVPVNIGGSFGNPYQSASHGFEANPATTPPKGTPITLIIRKRK